jgi:hypothetical protein
MQLEYSTRKEFPWFSKKDYWTPTGTWKWWAQMSAHMDPLDILITEMPTCTPETMHQITNLLRKPHYFPLYCHRHTCNIPLLQQANKVRFSNCAMMLMNSTRNAEFTHCSRHSYGVPKTPGGNTVARVSVPSLQVQ